MKFSSTKRFHTRGQLVEALGEYLVAYLAPVVRIDGELRRYLDGVWKPMAKDELVKSILAGLPDSPKWSIPALVDDTVKYLELVIETFPESGWVERPATINVKNGMLDISDPHKIRFLPHSADYRSRRQLPVSYDLEARCDRWRQFLAEVFPEGRDTAPSAGGKPLGEAKEKLLQEFMGYILMDTCEYERFLCLYGSGANGKSTLLNTIKKVLGSENMADIAPPDLERRFAVPKLRGKMAGVSAEMLPIGQKVSWDVFEKCLAGRVIEGELKYGPALSFRNTAKFIIQCNVPLFGEFDNPRLSCKMLMLEFARRFEKHEMDPGLCQRLELEADGILGWMLEGMQRLYDQGEFSEGICPLKVA